MTAKYEQPEYAAINGIDERSERRANELVEKSIAG